VKRPVGQSGQALIIAVLVMLVLAALGGYFVALLAQQAHQAAKESDLIAVREIAEAGLRFASNQLSESPEGADWRPSQPFYDIGDGRCEIAVSFTPGQGDPYSARFIKIESTGRLYQQKPAARAATAEEREREAEAALNPFTRRTVVGFKPIGISDYVRFVTNRDNLGEPTALGVPLQVSSLPYLTRFWGPVRVQGDLTWCGPARLELGTPSEWSAAPWNVEVAGLIRNDPLAIGADGVSLVCAALEDTASLVQESHPATGALFTTLKGRYRDGVRAEDAEGFARWASRFEPPQVSEKRYLALTRDSGVWKQDQSDRDASDNARQYNTGWYPNPDDPAGDGVAPGIFIDNREDIQFSHDREALRQNLMGLRSEYWDAPRNRLYTPPGVEIALDPGVDDPINPQPPRITLARHDQGFYRPNLSGPEKLGRVSTIVIPFPKNGVIYAQGNVRIRGTLPARTSGDPQSAYYVDDNKRHFSLTVVSGGTIYIEGSILTPLTVGLTKDAEGNDDPARDSKIALLAADSVVLNTTRFQGASLVQGQLASGQGEGYVPYEAAVDHALEFEFSLGAQLGEMLAGTQKLQLQLQLLLLHAGAPAAPPGAGGETVVQLLLNHLGNLTARDGRFDWSVCSQQSPLKDPAEALWTYDHALHNYTLQYYYWFSPSANVNSVNESRAIAPILEGKSLVIFDPTGTCLHPLQTPPATPDQQSSYLVKLDGKFGAAEPGVLQRLRFEVPPTSQNAYWLYNLAIQPLDIRVEALVYAQSGSWFVIPGQPFTTEAVPGAPDGFPGANEPLDIRVTVHGAVSENRAAALGDVVAWTQRWRGSDENFDAFTELPSDETNQVGFSLRQLEYRYDPELRSLLNSGDPGGPLRLPHLPACPGYIVFGERI
jgi:hypothetical protein